MKFISLRHVIIGVAYLCSLDRYVAADDATDFEGPHAVYHGSIKSYFAQTPPIPQCQQPLSDVICHSIQLDPSAMQSMKKAQQQLGRLHPSRAELIQKATALFESGKTAWDSRSLINQWSGLLNGFEQLQSLVALFTMAQAPALLDEALKKAGKKYSPRELEQLKEAKNEASFAKILAATKAMNWTEELGNVSQDDNKPLEVVPEVLLGFMSSRVMGKIFEQVFGPVSIDMSIVKKTLSINFQGTTNSFGAMACQALDYSLLYDFDPVWCSCAATDLVGYMLVCQDSATGPVNCTDVGSPVLDNVCTQATGVPIDPTSNTTSLDVRLMRPYDNTTSPTAEAPLYYFLFRGLQAFSAYTTTGAFCKETQTNPVHLLPGWKNVLEIQAAEEGEPMLSANGMAGLPVAMVARRYETDQTTPTCDFAILIRGTATSFEWLLDISYKRHPAADGNYTYEDGFNRFQASYQGIVDTYFDELIANGTCGCENLYIMTTGHSLGGGVGELTHLHLAERYNACGAVNDAVVFAPAHGLSKEASERMTTIGNIRSLIYELDAIPSFPCAQDSGHPRCNPELNLFGLGTGRDNYGPHVNVIEIPASFMGGPYVSTDFLTIELLGKDPGVHSYVPGPFQMSANHICTYACWTSTVGCNGADAFTWMCGEDCPLLA